MNQTVVPNRAADVVQPPPILDAIIDKAKYPDGADKLPEAALNQDATCGAPGPSGDATQPHGGGDDLAAAPQEPGEMPNADGVLTAVEQDASPELVAELEPKYSRPVHPVCDLFPMMGKADLNKLAEDIRVNGLAHPVVVHEGQIVDGRNRILACQLAGQEPRYVEWRDIYMGSMPLSRWIWSVNAERRHLTVDQIACIHAGLYALEAQEAARQRRVDAGKQQGEHGKEGGRGHGKPLPTISSEGVSETPKPEDEAEPKPAKDSLDDVGAIPPISSDGVPPAPEPKRGTDDKCGENNSGDVRKQLAREAGVSEHKMQQAMKVQKADPALAREVTQGKKKLSDAAKQVTAEKVTVKPPPTAREKRAPARKGKPEGTFDMERKIKAAMRSVDKVIDGLPDEQRDPFLRELITTLEAML